jgi:competence protein ComEC
VGGAENLLKIVPADKLYLPIWDGENKYKYALVHRYKDKIQWEEKDLFLDEGNITIFPSFEGEESNESGLCILFQPENCDILITGDRSTSGERDLIAHAELPDLEILVAGHHGSASSTSWELLDATRPEIVLISVGEGNTYGHPAKDTIDRLDLFGCTVYRTDLEGTIILRG